MNKHQEPELAGKPINKVLVFFIVGFALLMGAVDTTIVATALKSIEQSLATSINWAGWTLTAYAFGIMLMLPVTGKLSEMYGNRRVFIASILVFTLASVICGLVDHIYWLIVWRVVQAMGGAGFTPAATGIIVAYFGSSRDRAVSLFGTIFPIGALIGPVFGGLFVTYWNWRGIFFINLPVGLVIAWLAWRYIPHDKVQKHVREPMDAWGAIWLGSGLLSGMLAINGMGEKFHQSGMLASAFFAVLCVCFMLMFFHHIRTRCHPFIKAQLIYGKGFAAVNTINAVFGGMSVGMVALLPLYAANRYAMDALAAGSLLVAQGLAGIGMSIFGTIVLRRSGYRLPVYIGGSLIVAGLALVTLTPPLGMSAFQWLASCAFVIGIGTGTISPASRNAGLQLAPTHASTIAALRTLCFQLGTIIAVSLATAMLAGSHHPGNVHTLIYALAAFVFMCALPLVHRIPEHRGAW